LSAWATKVRLHILNIYIHYISDFHPLHLIVSRSPIKFLRSLMQVVQVVYYNRIICKFIRTSFNVLYP